MGEGPEAQGQQSSSERSQRHIFSVCGPRGHRPRSHMPLYTKEPSMFLGLRSRPAPVSQGLKTPVDSPPRAPARAAWAPWRDRTHHHRGAGGYHPVLNPKTQNVHLALYPQGTLRPQPLPAAGLHPHPSHLRSDVNSSPPRYHRAREAHSRVALPGQGVALQARAHSDVGERAAAATTLDGDAGGLGADPRGCDHNARDLHQV